MVLEAMVLLPVLLIFYDDITDETVVILAKCVVVQ